VSAIVSAEHAGDVTIVRLAAGENRFNPASLAAIEAALDDFETTDGSGALVISGDGKFFSNGLDIDWMASASPGDAEEMLRQAQRLLARILVFPAATVAAVNGHAFAAGAMLALACDSRVMREDRGYFCLPEVDLGFVFTAGMTGLLQARLPAATAHQAMVTGRRYGGTEAVTAGIAEEAVPAGRVLAAAAERAAALAAKPRATVAAIKRGLYGDVVAALGNSEPGELRRIWKAATAIRGGSAGA
jgi:enoyl-CoA hydratase/carnithine racemase